MNDRVFIVVVVVAPRQGYNGNSSDESDDQLDDDGGTQPVGMVAISNQYPAPQYPDGYVLGWHHPPFSICVNFCENFL